MISKPVDHLFRHHYGKMVAVLTRLFGPSNIELIEDAVQDTFIKAISKWRDEMPENPEGWLTAAAKNRAIDLLRQAQTIHQRHQNFIAGPSTIQLNELFLDHEIEDSQLRLIFMVCHPALKPHEQIAFALKTISGFSSKEISAALLQKEETIKKRLSRARATIVSENIQFTIPDKKQTSERIDRVMEVIYLIFNEGFHSTNKNQLVREDLCGEAMRLARILLKKDEFRTADLYALFALMCFHAARLESKINTNNEIVDLKNQDRNTWYQPLISLGHQSMKKALTDDHISSYHLEAAIAGEHASATTFNSTNWDKILGYYQQLEQIRETPSNKMNLSLVLMELGRLKEAKTMLDKIKSNELEQRQYLYYGCLAEYYSKSGEHQKALVWIDKAIDYVSNELEKNYLLQKRNELKNS